MNSITRILSAVLLCASIASCSDSSSPSSTNLPMKVDATEKALAEMTRQAESGDAAAQFALGATYEKGEQVPKDALKAVEWFRKAADQGYAKAQSALGKMYRDGEGVPRDYVSAVEWLQKAANQDDIEAQAYLGMMYRRGDGVAQDNVMGVKWCRQAADKGNAFAQHCLASAYLYGTGAMKDPTKALELFLKAAEQGDASASSSLYMMYARGNGVPKNIEKAITWLRKAADQGDAFAQHMLARSYEKGEGVPGDLALAVEWYMKAAAQGDTGAQVRLAKFYVRGEIVPRDLVLAYAWFNLVASSEFRTIEKLDAVQSRQELDNQLHPAQLAEAERLSSGWKKGSILTREQRGTQDASKLNIMKSSAGTLFLVSRAGQGITNQHVIRNCKEIRIQGHDGVAHIITEDSANDLALVQVPGRIDAVAPIVSEPGKLRQGEDIAVYGFPLTTVLSSSGNLTPGTVSAITGFGNNTNQIQVTAPIQPGSSGSPVVNKRGEVIGVISMKLSDTEMVKATGSVSQNVNFAVSGQTLRMFLDTHQVAYKSGTGWFSREKSLADIGDEAKKWTFIVECWK